MRRVPGGTNPKPRLQATHRLFALEPPGGAACSTAPTPPQAAPHTAGGQVMPTETAAPHPAAGGTGVNGAGEPAAGAPPPQRQWTPEDEGFMRAAIEQAG